MDPKTYRKKTPSRTANFLTVVAALIILAAIFYFFGAKEFPDSIEFEQSGSQQP